MSPKARDAEHYPLPQGAVTSMSNVRYWAGEILEHGIRQSHGIGPNRPLTAGERQDFEMIERATGRIFDRWAAER